jgi:hypothetical protein
MTLNPSTSFIGIFVRLFWMMIAPAVLLLLAYSLTQNAKGWFAPSSIAFLAVLLACLLARRLDPLTSEGTPTTSTHIRRYTIGLLSIGLSVWVIANLLGRYWLAS